MILKFYVRLEIVFLIQFLNTIMFDYTFSSDKKK